MSISRSTTPFLCLALLLLAVPAVAAKKNFDSSKAQVDFGVEMAQRGLWNEALFRFRQAERLGDNSSSVYNNIAVACEALGVFDQALEYYRKALDREPGNTPLKRNYSRFIEFYQSFKPDEEEAAEESDETTDAAPPEEDGGDPSR